MNVTYMIGNGFDLSCGLRTSYSDVYEGYCKLESSSQIIANFKNDIKGDLKTWGDFEMAMRDYMAKVDSEEDFLSCFYDFQDYMIRYLKEEEARFLRQFDNKERLWSEVCKNAENSAFFFYRGISNNVNSQFTFETANANKTYICYNYTSVLDKLLGEKHVVHVHGTLTNDPIVGIDNDTQFLHGLNFVPSSRLKRAFIKPRLNEACDTRRMIEAIKAIVDADVICIYGLSLGNSDLTWKETITEWLHSSSEHHLFVYDYYWMIKPHRTAAERFEHEDEARLNLFRKLNINGNEYNALTRQIHMPCGKKIFEIKEIVRYHEQEQTQLAKAREQEESNRKSSTGRLI